MKMNKIQYLILLLLLSVPVFSPAQDKQPVSQNDTAKSEFKQIAQEFSSTLQGILLGELKKGGAPGAVSVCSDTALKLTAEIGKKYGVEIRRISLKNRNPKNAPRNESETNLLLKMETAENNAAPANTITNKFFAAPIKVGAPCLQCHGSEEQINPETLKKINEFYPGDKARNYKAGDFRGAVVIERK